MVKAALGDLLGQRDPTLFGHTRPDLVRPASFMDSVPGRTLLDGNFRCESCSSLVDLLVCVGRHAGQVRLPIPRRPGRRGGGFRCCCGQSADGGSSRKL